MTGLASVSAPGRGATDRLLASVVTRLQADGLRIVGALKSPPAAGNGTHCDSDLWLLPDGPEVSITQNLGRGSAACRMDAGALEAAVGRAMARLEAEGADLVVINKFGLSEAEGRGFRALIARALEAGVPVLTGVSETHRAAFETFAGELGQALDPEETAVLDWCRTNAAPDAALAGER